MTNNENDKSIYIDDKKTVTDSTAADASPLSQASYKAVSGSRDVDPVLAAACRQAAAEGLVLLRNDNNCLPLARNEKIAVFGRVQHNYMYVGYGSGGDVNPPYTVSLIEGLEKNGSVQLDRELVEIYRKWCDANPPFEGFWADWPRYFEEMPISEDMIGQAAARNDKAIVVIGRAAGEDRENVLEPGSFYLTTDEQKLLDKVTSAFASTVIILDCGNIIDLSWLARYKDSVQAVIYAWQGGMESGNALADVLTGIVNPSGRLTDTIAHSYQDYPGADDFLGEVYNNYSEDIFVGYRFFETFAPERVLYPFGYGLSYTDFAIEPLSFELLEDAYISRVRVTNTGSKHAGQQVIQLYAEAPQGTLGKAARSLAAFAKTSLLAPGASETVELSGSLSLLSSYDDDGRSGHKSAYVLEAGQYRFHVGSNVRDTAVAGSFELAELRVIEQLRETAAVEEGKAFARMTAVSGDDGAVKLEYRLVPERTVDLKERILAELPAVVRSAGDDAAGTGKITLDDVRAGCATIEQLVASLSLQELADISRGDIVMDSPLGTPGNAGALGGVSDELRARGIVPATTCDGPSGIRISAYASLLPSGTALASTWNLPLLEKLASCHGTEMVAKDVDILLAPGMNIHRNPLCGRNFEYYSEDPFLTGKAAAAVVRGLQSQGVSACPKHFACNNQETWRNTNDSRLSERALREIYLRGFEICIKEAAPDTIMSSYNKINGVWGHYHYELCTSILRDEWGYQGLVMTDWWMQNADDPNFPTLSNNAYRVRAQVDVLMPGSAEHLGTEADTTLLDSYNSENGITLGELQRTAMNVIRFILKSNALRRRQK